MSSSTTLFLVIGLTRSCNLSFWSGILSSIHFYLHVAEGEEMHKSLRTEVRLVLRRFKVPACRWCQQKYIIQNILDYLLALLNNCCSVLLFILKELKQGVGRHFPRRLLCVDCKQLLNLRPLQKSVIECNKLIFIQGLKMRIVSNNQSLSFSPLSPHFPFLCLLRWILLPNPLWWSWC